MQLSCSLVLCLSIIVLSVDVVRSEFVPVFISDTYSKVERSPTLHKISHESFEELLLGYNQKVKPHVVVFVEETLSPEDFSHRDEEGRLALEELSKVKDQDVVTYFPYVQSPIKSIKQWMANKNNVASVTYFDLNDARDGENRYDMLKRHDATVVAKFNEAKKAKEHIMLVYTANHTSWVAAENSQSRGKRSLLQVKADNPNNPWFQNDLIMAYTSEIVSNNKSEAYTITAKKVDEAQTVLTYTVAGNNIDFAISKTIDGYWSITSVSANNKNGSVSSTIFAPTSFGYHCTEQIVTLDKTVYTFKDFQIEPLFDGTNASMFSDAYDCVGFTTVPIWSGLFVTLILLLIMTFGLTMMVDIKTMDRFDDAKGKTITINVTE